MTRYGIWDNEKRNYLRRLGTGPHGPVAWWSTMAEAEKALALLGYENSTRADRPNTGYVVHVPPEVLR